MKWTASLLGGPPLPPPPDPPAFDQRGNRIVILCQLDPPTSVHVPDGSEVQRRGSGEVLGVLEEFVTLSGV